ncbi:MAG: L,D-transpeptidase family protein [Bdellovibrionota bacterium]
MKKTAVKLSLISSLISPALMAQEKIPSNLLRIGDGSYYSEYAVVVDKDKRLTSVWQNANGKLQKVKEYVNDLGKASGDKKVEGDNKTPEGIYFFQSVLQGNQIPYEKYGVKALTTNYPNLFDEREGKTGYGIWLHAIPDTESLVRGSEGCVVVRNKDIEEISKLVKLDDSFFVVDDSLTYISEDELVKKRSEIEDFLKTWRRAWSEKNIDVYMAAYSDSFYSSKRNKKQWRAHKSRLNKYYKNIFVEFSDPVFVEVDDQIKVKMLQHYKSDVMDDYGEKTLYLEREETGLKIIAETFKRADRKKAAEIISIGSLLRDQNISSMTDKLEKIGATE